MSLKKFKQQAKLMKKRAEDMSVKLSYQQGLELIAVINGFKTWNALESSLNTPEEVLPMVLKENSVFSFWRLDYFYDRKNSGSFYVKINNKELAEDIKTSYDEECSVIDLAVKSSQLPEDDVVSINFAEEIDEESYLECTRKV